MNGVIDPRPMTSYSTFIVTLSLAATVSELQPLEICLNSIRPRFDHFRSREGQANGVIGPGIHDFLFNFNSNHGPKCKRFEVTAIRNMRDFVRLTSPGHSRSKPMPV